MGKLWLLLPLLLPGLVWAEPYQVIGDAIDEPLAPIKGSPELGKQIFVQREAGHCVLCHQVAGLAVPFQGNVGPDLSDVGQRLSPGQLRLRIVDASIVNADTIMPPYYRLQNLHRVAVNYLDKTVLSAAQIEHLVAYLSQQGRLEP